MTSRILILMAITLLGACADKADVSLSTQATVDSQVIASSYAVSVQFLAEAKTQAEATAQIKARINPFEVWVGAEGFDMQAGRHELRPVYQYSPNNQRQLVAYEVSQQFQLRELTFEQYQLVLANSPQFKPHQVSLSSVEASDGDKQKTKESLIEQAFSENRQKALAMAQAANLCRPQVSEMSEQFHMVGRPMMMAMERMASSSEGVHETQSKQSMRLTLSIKWLAEAGCGE